MTENPEAQTATSRLAKYTGDKVARLQSAHLAGSQQARALLAKLRAGVNRPLGADFELVGLTVAGLEPVTAPDTATIREQSAYTAITLYALHQQGTSLAVHTAGPSLGAALSIVRRSGNGSEAAIRRRFTALATATGWDEIRYHCRSLIPLIREVGARLDYGRLADDLRKLQDPDTAMKVRLAWGRDFEYTPSIKSKEAKDN